MTWSSLKPTQSAAKDVGGPLACGRRKDEQRARVAAARRGAHLRARERQNRVRGVPGQALDAGLPARQLQQVRLCACACQWAGSGLV